MRKSALVFGLIAGMAGVSNVAAQAQQAVQPMPIPAGAKFAFVNSERLIQQAPGAAEASTTIQREMDKYQAELALLEDSIRNMVTDYQQKQALLSPDSKKKQEDAIRAKETSLRTRSEQYQQNIEKRQRDLIKPVMDRINKTLEEVRKEGDFAIIFNSAGGAIIAADTTLDLTDKVLARLKSTASAPKKP